jgi:hypothetical protein
VRLNGGNSKGGEKVRERNKGVRRKAERERERCEEIHNNKYIGR